MFAQTAAQHQEPQMQTLTFYKKRTCRGRRQRTQRAEGLLLRLRSASISVGAGDARPNREFYRRERCGKQLAPPHREDDYFRSKVKSFAPLSVTSAVKPELAASW